MKERDEQQLTPKRIDEQIEAWLIDGSQTASETRFPNEMQMVTRHLRAEHEQALKRVEDRLLHYTLTHTEHSALSGDKQRRFSSVREIQREDYPLMEQKKHETRQSSLGRQLSLLVAFLIVAVLVGGLVLIQKSLSQSRTTQTGTSTLATATSSHLAEGTVVYATSPSSTSPLSGFSRLAWSPDSRRIASLDNQEVLKIWDATTGKHTITISMPGKQDTPLDISWSPDSRWLAVATGAHLLIVDSQSGAITRMYTAPGTSLSLSPGSSYLSTTLPQGGDTHGFNAVAWSPNGRWLATSLTLNAPVSTIRVLDAQTGTTAFTLPGGGYGTSSFAWSFDSQYLAAFTLTTVTSPAIYKNQVWNIATHQLVASYPGKSVGGAVWRPGTHTLALVSTSDHLASTLVIWDPLTGKKLRQIPIADENGASGSLAWSPDGQRLVYGIIPSSRQQKAAAVIVNATTGQQLYVYPAGDSHSGALVAWSPDGTYIISGTGPVYSSAEATPGAQVWIA